MLSPLTMLDVLFISNMLLVFEVILVVVNGHLLSVLPRLAFINIFVFCVFYSFIVLHVPLNYSFSVLLIIFTLFVFF